MTVQEKRAEMLKICHTKYVPSCGDGGGCPLMFNHPGYDLCDFAKDEFVEKFYEQMCGNHTPGGIDNHTQQGIGNDTPEGIGNEPQGVCRTPELNEASDPVSHPPHYTQGGIECIDAMVAAFGKEVVANFCKCNAFKYIWRAVHKNGDEDIEKAIWYLNKHKELTTND